MNRVRRGGKESDNETVRVWNGDCPGIFSGVAQAERYALEVFPAEHEKRVDEVTGAELTFLTTHPARDRNLYFHEWSWLKDGSMIIFYSDRENGGLMGYLTATGELVRLQTPSGGLTNATCAIDRNSVYAPAAWKRSR